MIAGGILEILWIAHDIVYSVLRTYGLFTYFNIKLIGKKKKTYNIKSYLIPTLCAVNLIYRNAGPIGRRRVRKRIVRYSRNLNATVYRIYGTVTIVGNVAVKRKANTDREQLHFRI